MEQIENADVMTKFYIIFSLMPKPCPQTDENFPDLKLVY